eukprot:365354-Chlamydomonas_euryale.AAC.2
MAVTCLCQLPLFTGPAQSPLTRPSHGMPFPSRRSDHSPSPHTVFLSPSRRPDHSPNPHMVSLSLPTGLTTHPALTRPDHSPSPHTVFLSPSRRPDPSPNPHMVSLSLPAGLTTHPALTRYSFPLPAGLTNPGAFAIGDTLCSGPAVHFPPIPTFSPELFAYIRCAPSQRKPFTKVWKRGGEGMEGCARRKVWMGGSFRRSQPPLAAAAASSSFVCCFASQPTSPARNVVQVWASRSVEAGVQLVCLTPHTERFPLKSQAIEGLLGEGAVQVLYSEDTFKTDPLLAACGQLQFEVVGVDGCGRALRSNAA